MLPPPRALDKEDDPAERSFPRAPRRVAIFLCGLRGSQLIQAFCQTTLSTSRGVVMHSRREREPIQHPGEQTKRLFSRVLIAIMDCFEEQLGFVLHLGTTPTIPRTAVYVLSNSFLR